MTTPKPTPAQLQKFEDRLVAREMLERWLAQQPPRVRQLVAVLAQGLRVARGRR